MPRLPEEILDRVLADVLDIPDSEFYGDPNLRLNPGARWQRSFNQNYPRDEDRRPPALLRVCKSWRRIGTPHLYRSIFIRRECQATALANTLTNLRPDLGAYIWRFRPCAGRGLVMLGILTAMTQLRVLNLVLVARFDNDIQGLVAGLALSHLNPAELRLHCDESYAVSMREALINILARVLPNWTNLKAAHISWSLPFWGRPGEEFAGLIRKLAIAPSLATVQLPYELQTVRLIPTLEILARNPSLRSIDMSRPRDHYCSFDRAIFRNPLLDPLCEYRARGATVPDYPSAESIEIQRLVERVQQQEAEFTAVSTRIASTPSKNSMLQQHFEVQKKVWSRVLEFATPKPRSVRPGGVIILMMVCRMWRWLLLPALYSIATADSGIKTYRLSCTLLLNPALGQYFQELRLANHLANNLFVPLGSVLRASPHLRRLAATGWQSDRYGKNFPLQLEWTEFTILATYAPVLESVSAVKILKTVPKAVSAVLADTPTMASYLHQSVLESTTEDLSVPLGLLMPFRSLRSLHLIVPIMLEFRGATVRSDVFPALEVLRLEDCHPSVLRLFALFDLPRLRLVGLLGASHRASDASLILWRHGTKIEELELEYFPTNALFGFCGRLTVLEIRQQLPPPDESAAGWQSGSLETLVCNGINAYSNAVIVKRWGEVFASIDSQRLPRLKVIRGWMSRPTGVLANVGRMWLPHAEELRAKGIALWC